MLEESFSPNTAGSRTPLLPSAPRHSDTKEAHNAPAPHRSRPPAAPRRAGRSLRFPPQHRVPPAAGRQRPRHAAEGAPRSATAGPGGASGAARPGKEGGGGSCHVLCGERSASAPRAAERGSCRRPLRALLLSLSLANATPGKGARGRRPEVRGASPGEARRRRGSVRADFLRLPAPLAERRGEEAQSLRAAVRGRPAGGRAAAGRDGAVRGCAAGLSRCPFGDPRGEQLLESPAASSIAFTLFGISVLRPRVLLRVGDEWGAAFVQPGGGSENLRKAFKGEPGRGEPR